jgi:hypothetical protein
MAAQKAFGAEIDRLQRRVGEAENERDQASVKAARLDQLVSVLESEDNDGDPMLRMRDSVVS